MLGRLFRPGSPAGSRTKPTLSLTPASQPSSAVDDDKRPGTAMSETSDWNQAPPTPSKSTHKVRYIKASLNEPNAWVSVTKY
jgi:hypothetical protein